MIKCVICSQSVTSKRGLAFHIKKHDIESVDKYIEMYPDQIQYIEPKDDSLLTCPICGRYNMKQLGQHITGTHKMTHDEFIAMYPNQKMFIDEISDRCRKATLIGRDKYYENKKADPEKYAKMIKDRTEKRIQNNPDISDKIKKGQQNSERYQNTRYLVSELWKNEDYRKMQSEKAKKQHENGLTEIIVSKSGKKRYQVTLGDITYSMRSTWEIKFAKFLYENNVNFKYEPFVIKYVYDNKVRSYYPDFIIDGTNILYEVKPKNLIGKDINIAKMNASIDHGYDFIYITEDDLSNLSNFKFPDVT